MSASAITTTESESVSTQDPMPRWDMTPIFPSLESEEFTRAHHAVVDAIAALQELFDRHRVGADGGGGSAAVDETVAAYEEVTDRYNAVLEQLGVIRAYVSSFISTDSRNATAQARASELQREGIPLRMLSTRYTAWLGAMDIDALIARSPVAAAHAYYLREAKIAATHLLPPAEEDLAARLSLSGGSAWSKLHGDLTSQILVPIRRTEGAAEESVPMSVIRALASDPDRDVRRRAYEAELAAWERASIPLAAAINSIKYETGVLSERRAWSSPLDAACFNNHIDGATLEAMLSAARASFPDFRRYLRAKSRAIAGTDRLAWYDLFAPMGASERSWRWNDATEFVEEQFGAYSEKMRAYAARAFRERWVDAAPRPGKRDGAFCMLIRGDESRILHNYRPTYDAVSTLAHELGHGYHNLCLFGRTSLQRGTPMTLAETASIFCETIIKEAVIADAGRDEQILILEASLQGQCQVVVDITSRLLFEQRLLAARRDREQSVVELNALMLQAQTETYGDGLDESLQHPYMWAVKSHYYGSTFYNFPYMFGLLFGLGLYARFREDPTGFRAGYDVLLSSTGMDDAATLAARFGYDIRDEAFWRSSLAVIVKDIDRFVARIGGA